MDEKQIIEALNDIVFYNGLDDAIQEWKNLLPENGCINTDYYRKYASEPALCAQLQVFWMLCVLLFGEMDNYGKNAWICEENIEEFHSFLDQITSED